MAIHRLLCEDGLSYALSHAAVINYINFEIFVLVEELFKKIPVLILLILSIGCVQKTNTTYYTWTGIGPDKWASVWLIHRHIDADASVQFVPVNGISNNLSAIAFDIPGANYKRTSQASTIASMAKVWQVEEKEGVSKVAEIIHDIEIISWGEHTNSRSAVAEIAFRGLQKKYGRDQVPPACYIEFFDRLETALLNDIPEISDDNFRQAIVPEKTCANRKLAFEGTNNKKQLVEEIPVRDVLSMMKSGKKVVFVDAREPAEYDEFHIPKAINLQLRNVDADSAAQFAAADMVIAYCLKDFRGFELAKALKQRGGIEQVAILNPYGINGWRTVGLPITGSKALSSSEAEQLLQKCVFDPSVCLTN